jgi:hypothetical protein
LSCGLLMVSAGTKKSGGASAPNVDITVKRSVPRSESCATQAKEAAIRHVMIASKSIISKEPDSESQETDWVGCLRSQQRPSKGGTNKSQTGSRNEGRDEWTGCIDLSLFVIV